MAAGERTPEVLPDGLADLPAGPRLGVALAEIDPTRLTAHQLVVLIAARNRQIAHEQAQLLLALRELGHAPPQERDRVVREPDRNAFAVVEAAFGGTWTTYRCELLVSLAEFVFDEAPQLGEALAAGRVDLDKVKVFLRMLSGVVDRELLREIVAQALGKAADDTTATLRARLQRILARRDPQAIRKRRARDHDDRFVDRFTEPTGLVSLVARFCDPAAATAAYEHINAIALATHRTGDPAGRRIGQLRHDIMLSLLAGVDPATAGFATPADRKGTIVLHVGLATLLGDCPGRTDEPGEIAGHGPVTAHIARETAVQLAQVSRWRYAVDDDGQVVAEGSLPAHVLPGVYEQLRRWAVDAPAGPDGRARYRPTAAQLAFVRARDLRCQAPGCRVPAHRCQVDHRIPWQRGGPTFVDNLYCLCARHHRAKDEAGHRYRPVPGGIVWTTAAGHTYRRARESVREPVDRRPARRPRVQPIVHVELAGHLRR